MMIVVIVWMVLATAFSFYFSVIAREKYLNIGNKLALREGIYSAGRGSILDKNRKRLAWSEKYFDLFLIKSPHLPKFQKHLFKKLKLVLPDMKPFHEDEDSDIRLIYRNVPVRKIGNLSNLVHEYPSLKIIPRTERVVIDYPAVKHYIGRVEMVNGELCGVSGAELKYDDVLRGISGCYVVMLDRNKNWIKDTWREIRKGVRGKDVILDKSLDELLAGAEKP